MVKYAVLMQGADPIPRPLEYSNRGQTVVTRSGQIAVKRTRWEKAGPGASSPLSHDKLLKPYASD